MARRKAKAPGLGSSCRLVVADTEGYRSLVGPSIPLPSGSGFANTLHPEAALREIIGVLRPGGRLVVLEFGHPRGLYDLVAFTLKPWLGRVISRHGKGYPYLPASI